MGFFFSLSVLSRYNYSFVHMDLLVGTVYQVSGVARGSFVLQKKSNATTINGAIIVLSIALFNITLDFFLYSCGDATTAGEET